MLPGLEWIDEVEQEFGSVARPARRPVDPAEPSISLGAENVALRVEVAQPGRQARPRLLRRIPPDDALREMLFLGVDLARIIDASRRCSQTNAQGSPK
jgi:hypothetical protein